MNEASLYLICVLSVDRFYAVFYPIHRPCILTTPRLTCICAISWIFPVLKNMYPFIRGAHFYYFDILGFYISTPFSTSAHEETIIYIWSNVFVLLPFCVTVGFCLAVVSKLAQYKSRPRPGIHLELMNRQPVNVLAPTTKKQSIARSPGRLIRMLSKMNRLPTSSSERRCSGARVATKRRSGQNTDKHNIVAVIITLYILCLLPGISFNVYEMLLTFNALPDSASVGNMSDKMISVYIYFSLVFSTLLFTLNSCVNPFIYYFRCNPIFILPRPIARALYVWRVKFRCKLNV